MGKVDIDAKAWDESVRQYGRLKFYPEQFADDDVQPAMQLLKLMEDLLRQSIQQGRISDQWQVYCNIFPYGQEVWFCSRRFLSEFKLGVDLLHRESRRRRDADSIVYLSTSITHASFLRHMTDEWWALLTSLSDVGSLSFEPDELPTTEAGDKNTEQLFRNKVSSVFQLCRNYVLLMQAGTEEGRELDLGSVTVSWSIQTTLNELAGKVQQATRILYTLKQMLYRPFYQQYHEGMRKWYATLTPEQQKVHGDVNKYLDYLQDSHWKSRWADSNPRLDNSPPQS